MAPDVWGTASSSFTASLTRRLRRRRAGPRWPALGACEPQPRGSRPRRPRHRALARHLHRLGPRPPCRTRPFTTHADLRPRLEDGRLPVVRRAAGRVARARREDPRPLHLHRLGRRPPVAHDRLRHRPIGSAAVGPASSGSDEAIKHISQDSGHHSQKSASRRIVTICSSVNRVFFMAPPCLEDAILSSVSWSENRQAGQAGESRMTPPASSSSSQVRPRISCLRQPE